MVPNRWSLGLRLRLNEKPLPQDECVTCEDPDCRQRRHATKVCHHTDCQELNDSNPLHLCESCDSRRHPDDCTRSDRHPRFTLQTPGSNLARNVSTRSCPPRTRPHSDLEEEEEPESGEPKPRGVKLRAREGKKARRRHTDDPRKQCFSLKFHLNTHTHTEVIPAVKKRTLREVLTPVFERSGLELPQVELFLDQSNTPLSLDFEAYRFGGHDLRVKARADALKAEQEVKDLRSLSLPNMKASGGGGVFIITPGSEGADPSESRRESVDVLCQARRRKNMTEFLGDRSIPSAEPSAVGVSLSGVAPAGVAGADNWKNRATRGISVLFGAGAGKEMDRMELLHTKLQAYTQFGLPKAPQLSFHQDSWEEEEDEPDLTLEESWRELLDQPESLSRREFQQQEAVWELIHTEATYIRKLRLITDLFLRALLTLQDNGLLCEVDPSRLFCNIQDLVRLHCRLWLEVMTPALRNARASRGPIRPADLQEGFSTFASRFRPYLQFCLEEEKRTELMRSLLRDNELFRVYVTWAETDEQCRRLKLADMLATPHQRLTKYPLLLKTILKKTDHQPSRDALSSMVECVEDFINSVDSQMRQRQEKQKLAAVSSRVESYEAVDGGSEEVERLLKEFSRFDLMAPMLETSAEETRQLHLEGALRMKEGRDSRVEVHCFLFSDVLLITKPSRRVERVRVVRPPLLLHQVVCRELRDPGSFLLICLNEFRSAVAAYSFQAGSAAQGRAWQDAVCEVQARLRRLRSEEARRRKTLPLTNHAEEEEEEVSGGSGFSSPRLTQQNHSQSDGSTETLSVTDVDEWACAAPPPPGRDQGCGETQSRSASMDSAYGTLSPAAPPEKPPPQEDHAPPKLRRRPPLQCRLPRPQRLAAKSRSEDDLLSRATPQRERRGHAEDAALRRSLSELTAGHAHMRPHPLQRTDHAQQKLTLSELCRLRTTLVLNSTLTASEV